MTAYEIFGVCIVFIGAIGWVVRMSVNMQKFRTTTELRLGEMSLKLTKLECDMNNQKGTIDLSIETMRKENREDHQIMFEMINKIVLK